MEEAVVEGEEEGEEEALALAEAALHGACSEGKVPEAAVVEQDGGDDAAEEQVRTMEEQVQTAEAPVPMAEVPGEWQPPKRRRRKERMRGCE